MQFPPFLQSASDVDVRLHEKSMHLVMLLAVMSAEASPGVSGLQRLRSETPQPDTIPNYLSIASYLCSVWLAHVWLVMP